MKAKIQAQILNVLMPLLPKQELSQWVGQAVSYKLPGPLAQMSVHAFAKFYNINLDEAEFPIEHYKTVGDLFTRRLKGSARPISEGVVHPCDAQITEAGVIEKLQMIQAKGKHYTVAELLRNNQWALRFEGGTYLTYYLCPTDYHRVHVPLAGRLTWAAHVPGQLWPVNAWSVQKIDQLFAVNERVVAGFESDLGAAALVMVGATNVGYMSLSFDSSFSTQIRNGERAMREKSYVPPLAMKSGDEFGIFHMGSTVVMLYEKGVIPPQALVGLRNSRVRFGQTLFMR